MSAPVPAPITARTVIAIHDDQIARHGGMPGLRDEGLLASALASPHLTFDGQDLYPTFADKAARYCIGIVGNHPFVDGNKRTGAALVFAFLRANGVSFEPDSDEFARVVRGLAAGTLSADEFTRWVSGIAHGL